MSFDLIIKNGTVILENEARVVDIAVKGGKIAAIGQDLGDAPQVATKHLKPTTPTSSSSCRRSML